MIYALNYINYIFLFGFRKMSQEKTTIAQQKKRVQLWNVSTVFGKGSNRDKARFYRDINIF